MPYKYSYDYEEKEYIPRKLRTNRSMWEFMILTIITFGIYGILFFAPFTADLDKVAPKRDRSKTMNYLFVFILIPSSLLFFIYIFFLSLSHSSSLPELIARVCLSINLLKAFTF